MKLLLTKHGLTIENEQGITQGWMPGRLSPTGKEQIKNLIERLKNYHIDVIYSSDLARSAETAKMIKKAHPESRFFVVKALREKNHGSSEGRVHSDYSEEEKKRYHDLDNAENGGESMRQMYKRVKKFYDSLVSQHKDDTVLLVGHGGSVRALICLVEGKEPEEMLEIEGLNGPSLTEYNIDEKGFKKLYDRCEKHLK